MAEPQEPDAIPEDFEPIAREGEHLPPVVDGEAFHCPHCGVLSPMLWNDLHYYDAGTTYPALAKRVQCAVCQDTAYWINYRERKANEHHVWWKNNWRMVLPRQGAGPRPHPQMPDDVRADYEEARAIVNESPRGACALLRFALQTLLDHLGQEGKTPNDAIGALVNKGLPVETAQALDVLRVIGNNAVHPLELDLKDDVETATGLFGVINFIVQDRIAQPKAIDKMFALLPEGARNAIKRRDKTEE